MHKITFITITFITITLTLLMPPYSATAGIDLPWSTTFDCPEWDNYAPLTCDGISRGGAWTSSPEGYYEQITAGANNPGGNGGRGQRHWIGNGTNNNSGTIGVNFNTPPNKIWIRWYQRWEPGFTNTSTLTKEIYFYTDAGQLVHENRGEVGTLLVADSKGYYYNDIGGFDYWFPGGISDGTWTCFEILIDIPGQKYKYWIDGQLMIDDFMDYGNITQITTMQVPVNSKTVDNPGNRSYYVDFDDIAISSTGYIGPISGGGGGQDTTPPSVSISSPTHGQTVAGNVTLSSTASDNVSVSGVQFIIDGADYGSEDTSAPYSINSDTTTLSDGSHTLTALAKDAAGNQTTSAAVDFTVNNGGGAGVDLFSESFEDTNFSTRGWYDNTILQLTTAEHIPGSTKSLEFHFNQGATQPTSGGAVRKKFSETDQIYLSYYVKYSANWEGSNKSYHPHEFMVLTNLDGDWSNLASTHLTTYLEQNEGEPLISIQDSLNIDQSNINVDLTSITENRAVAGCNGDSDGHGNGTCYSAGTGYWNGKQWKAGNIYFQDNPGSYYKNDWHHIEALIKLNSITNATANKDGIIQYWYDGQLIIDHSDVVIRTGQHPNMLFNQFIIAPYIGDGSPVAQTFWIDDLSVATVNPTQGTPISPPAGFQLSNN